VVFEIRDAERTDTLIAILLAPPWDKTTTQKSCIGIFSFCDGHCSPYRLWETLLQILWTCQPENTRTHNAENTETTHVNSNLRRLFSLCRQKCPNFDARYRNFPKRRMRHRAQQNLITPHHSSLNRHLIAPLGIYMAVRTNSYNTISVEVAAAVEKSGAHSL